jgi:transcriptional regulator MraZ
MFRGSSHQTVDGKGRVSIPARYREILKGNQETHLIVTTYEGYLLVYPQSAWAKVEQGLEDSDQLEVKNRAHIRYLVAQAEECAIDKQGRILIPKNLREYANLDGDVTIVGMLSNFEIWDRQHYMAYRQQQEEAVKKSTLAGLPT